MNKKIIGLVIGFVVIAGVSFYFGNQYANNKNQSALSQNVSARSFGGTNGQRGRANGGNIFGKIIARDTNSITVELSSVGVNGGNQNGTNTTAQVGSKIVFYTNTTPVTKTIVGTSNDLSIGAQVVISGATNADGSINAQSVQIRPTPPTTN